ncbi:MAG: outer membrane beta-barrel protein [Pseudomonadota bacterium]
MSGQGLKNKLLISAAAVAILSYASPSFSADSQLQVDERLASSHDWSGPYLGFHIGINGVNSEGDFQFTTSSYTNLGALDGFGLIGGGHIGWNFLEDDFLLGIEGDLSFLDFDETVNEAEGFAAAGESITSFDADYLASVRGRVGIVDDDVLFYATAGVAFLGGDLTTTDGGGGAVEVDVAGPVGGFGIEWAASNNLRLRTEWLYASFEKNVGLDGGFPVGVQTEDFFEVDDILTFRAGVSWNFDGAPVFDINEDEEVHDWAGLFLGGYIGAGLLDTSGAFDTTDSDSTIDLGGISDAGILGGGTIGWNYQLDNFVAGIQADISFIDWDGVSREANSRVDRLELETDYVATVRGRLGYADGDLLVYGTAGVAFIEGELVDPTGLSTGQNVDFSETGLAYGAGMEWAVNESLSIQVEGLYLDFDESTDLSNIGGGDAGNAFVVEDGLLAKVGINWSFN